MEKAKPGQATLFSTRVESSDSRRVRWKRANDNVAWSERAFVRNRVEMEVKKQARVWKWILREPSGGNEETCNLV